MLLPSVCRSLTEPRPGIWIRRLPLYLIREMPEAARKEAGAGTPLLVETWWAGLMVSVAPVCDGGAEVHEGALGDVFGDFGGEGVVLALTGVEGFVEILPGWPR